MSVVNAVVIDFTIMKELIEYGESTVVITLNPKTNLNIAHIAITKANELSNIDGGVEKYRITTGEIIPDIETNLVFCTPDTKNMANNIANKNNCEVILLWN